MRSGFEGAYGAPRGPGGSSGRRTVPLWAALAAVGICVGALLAVLIWISSGGPAGPWWPHPWFWPIFPLGFLIVLLVACSLFWRFGAWGRARYWGAGSCGDSASAIARERYSRGEISRDQLVQILRDLEQLG